MNSDEIEKCEKYIILKDKENFERLKRSKPSQNVIGDLQKIKEQLLVYNIIFSSNLFLNNRMI